MPLTERGFDRNAMHRQFDLALCMALACFVCVIRHVQDQLGGPAPLPSVSVYSSVSLVKRR